MSPAAQDSTGLRSRKFTAAAWLHPVKGVGYFARHRFLWPLVRARLVPCMLLSLFVFSSLFIGTYLPQVALMRVFHGKGAWVNGVFLVLGEGAAITALLFEAFLVDDTQAKIFDAILLHEGHDELVAAVRQLDDADGEADPVRRLGKQHRSVSYAPFSLRQIVEFILFLPLNLVPWIGVPLFLWLTGYRAGPLQHHRYFKMRGFGQAERKAHVQVHRLGYTAFGCVALVLQLVPVLSMLFLMTTAAGSAMWASQLEDMARFDDAEPGSSFERQQQQPQQQQHQQQQPPPYEYTDNPV